MLSLLISLLQNKLYITVPFVVSVFVMHCIYIYTEKKQTKARFIKTGKKWLIDNELIQLGGLVHLLNLGIWIPSLFDADRQWTDGSEIILSTGLVLYTLLFYTSIKIVTPKLKNETAKMHSEYNFN